MNALELLGLSEEEPWQERALCREVDPELFFPEKGEPMKGAKLVCARCEVRTECLTYALDNGERFGLWGGVTERDRRKLIRIRDKAAS